MRSSQDDAAISIGIDVTREKHKITALTSGMCPLGGAVFAQCQMHGPDTLAGLDHSLNIVFVVLAGGMWVMFSHRGGDPYPSSGRQPAQQR